MKIINITSKETYLCSLSAAEVRLITGGKFYYSDFKDILDNETDLDLSKFNKLPAKYDLDNVESAVKSLESAIKFLNNKKESLEYINSIKGIK